MKQHNKDKRLEQRRRDFAKGSQSREGKVQNRWDAGGYHAPGSNNK